MSAPPDPTDNTIIPWPQYKVYSRASTAEGAWTEQPHLLCSRIHETAAPRMPTASFEFLAGEVIHPDMDDFGIEPPLDLIGQIVRVDLLKPVDETADTTTGGGGGEPTPPAVQRRWYFRIVSDDQDIGADQTGTDPDAVAQPVRQRLAGVGLEYDLERTPISGAGVHYKLTDDVVAMVTTPQVFNERSRVGLHKPGNRSEDKHDLTDLLELAPDAEPRTCYLFEADPNYDGTGGDEWSVADIIEYAVSVFCRRFNVKLSYQTEEAQADLLSALQAMKPPRLEAEGMSLYGLLNRLINPSRGLGWRLRYPEPDADTEDTAAIVPELHIFPLSSDAITITDDTLPGNSDTVSIDVTDDETVAECKVGESEALKYSKIRVQGEAVLSCFTVNQDKDGTLEADWTPEEEEAYKNACQVADPSSALAQYFAQDRDKYRHVFTRYRLPRRWDGMARDGVGGTKTMVLPTVGSGGALDDGTRSPLMRVGRGFENILPIEDVTAEAAAAEADVDHQLPEKLYKLPFFLVQYQDDVKEGANAGQTFNRWGYIDQMTDPFPAGSVYMNPDHMAIQVQSHNSSVMAGGDAIATGAPKDAFGGDGSNPFAMGYYKWQSCLATVSLRLDQRLFVEQTIADDDGPTLTINVPNAELWLIGLGTVTGIDPGGALHHHTGDRVVRDDTPRLTEILNLAAAWYGQRRRDLSIVWRGAVTDYTLGQLADVTTKGSDDPISLPITDVLYDFVGATTTLLGEFRPPNFAEEEQ